MWTVPGPQFGPEQLKVMLVFRKMNEMKSSGADFRAKIDKKLHDLCYRPSISDPDVCMRSAVKPGGFMYYQYVICYAGDVLCISDDPISTMKGIQSKFKLKGDNIEEPGM